MAKSCDGADVLALELTRYTAFNNALSLAEIMPLLRKLLSQHASVSYTAFDLLCLLQAREEVEAAVVAKRFHALMLKEAVLTAEVRLAKPELALRPSPLLDHLPQAMPMGWRNDEHVLAVLRQAAQLERDRVFLSTVAPDLSGPLHAVTAACGQQRRLLFALAARWDLLPLSQLGANDAEPPESEIVPAELCDRRSGEEIQLEALAARVRAAAQTWAPGRAVPDALRELVAWPGAAAVAPLLAVCAETPAWQPYVEHALAFRTRLEYTQWEDWACWLKGVSEKAVKIREYAARLADEFRDELRLLRLKDPAGPRDDVRMAELESAAAERAKLTVGPAEFVRRWEHVLSPAEVRRLCGEPPAEDRSQEGVEAQEREARLPAPPPLPQKKEAAPPPPAPSFWDRHIRPFIAANWYLLAGLLMVVSGASLLAYFTWDKSVFVRYLFLPVLLGAFTAGLAELGLRLYRRHDELRATGSFLLGGAVCLLPVNFMVLCRAGADPLAAHLILPAFGLYATLAGAGLWRWCGALRSELRILLGLPLLAVNLLAVLGDLPPLREAFAAQGAGLVPVTLTAAVLLLLAVTDRFLWRVLDSAMLASKHVPWFFGITMAATTVQVAAWRHFHLRAVPQPQDYALATILAGALLLRWERRVVQIRNNGVAYGGESFLGYAALLAGILLSATHEWLRLAALFLAGVIWLVQAPRRPGVVHYWAGLTLCLLGGAACGMLSVFPKRGELNLLPELGLALALAAGGVRVLAGRLGDLRLRQVAREIQPPILLLTAVIALLSHYHLRSAPWQTGLVLLAVALFFAVRGTREQRREGLFVAAAAAGLSLPYLGCADMGRYGFADNTLALGLGVLAAAWLVAARLLRSPLWRASCGGIVTCLGAFGLVGLGLRLVLAGTPVLTPADLAGGALLSAALAVAAWQTRAQTPALMVAVLLAVILPLFQVPAGVVPAGLHVGSGLTSAAVALALMAGCFRGRREEQERHLPGLFTRPALFAVAWLSGQALAHQIQRHDVPWPFIASVLLVSATGYVAALFFREQRSGKALFHLSWPLLGVGIVLGCRAAGCRGVEWIQHPLLWTGVAMTALVGLESACARRWAWITDFLVRPRLALLAYGSAAVALGLAAGLVGPLSQDRGGLQGLAGFLAAQLVWHALRSRSRRFGAVLFALAAAWLSVSPNAHALCGAVPVFLLATLLADVGLERVPRSRDLLSPLRTPFVAGATGLALALFGAALLALRSGGGVLDFGVPRQDLYALLAALLLAARAQSCAGLGLPAAALAYLVLLVPCAQPALFQPWRLSALAGVLCLMPFVGRSVTARCPQLLRGGSPQFPALAAAAQAPWLLVPGVALAVGAAAWQMALSAAGQALDPLGIQILPPFAAAAAFALAGWYGRSGALWAVAACLLPLAQGFACAVVWGRELLDRQLTPAHIVGLAAVATVAELAAVRLLTLRLMRPAMTAAARWLHGECVALAGLTLVLLGMNYLASPDLAHIPALRFLASGLLALGAGAYFRSAARRPELVQTSEGVSMEALWHVALGLALWCAALMVPALRTPHAALYALALPAVACWCAAETFLNLREGSGRNRLTGLRFLNSAAAFAVLVLVLFVFRLPFQLLLFPGAPLDPRVYHTGSAAALAAGLILLRLRGLGGAPWLALTGGLALMSGVFFGVTGLPGLSPFVFPMASAWTSVVIAHLLILLSCRQSPLRTLIQHVGGIGAEEWQAHRRLWGTFLTFAVHGVVLHGLLSGGPAHSADTTPLLAALSSVLVHQAWIGSPCANAYRAVAVVELVLALHLDFLLPAGSPGLIPARHVVWFVLSSWLGAAVFWTRVRQPLPARVMWCAAGGLALLSAGHLCYHGAASGSGVLIAALLTLAGLLTPKPDAAPGARLAALMFFAAPVWLAYFGTWWLTGDGPAGFRPLLAGATALLGSGVLVRAAEQKNRLAGFSRACVRLADEALDLCRRDGERLARALLCAAFAGLVFITFLHGEARHGSLGLMLGLALVWGLSCAAWFREGTLRDGAYPYALAVLSLAGTWTLLRRLLFQHFSFWTYEYDIWLSLGASLAFSAARRLVRHQRPGLARTMTGTVWLLPAVQGVWLLATRMNADLTLLVLGVQSMLFAWQGGGRRDSPYNAVSVLGFVGFVCLLFWAKLDLRCLQAFTVPCGLGVLGLVWLFGEQMPSALRTAVRFFAVLTMLGSCGYYALLDQSYPVGFHVTMLVLCLAIMALGPALRVQLYLYFGFAGLVADLAALVVRQFQSLERSLQMMGVGALLLLLGIAVIGGAILFKTRREAIAACAARIRGRLRGWE